ncbi:hypothetical protein HAX54_027205 [Datura stramonium]|uniref:Galactose oxidase-like Early set domain-containing protein n=1 Tax=Datura stramonium TaxID=4076 RepID=A0ABS8RM43_DATST|nr:hypothetical protein [Datura stramonium]
MYHSTSVLLRDGRILVGGSNPHVLQLHTGVLSPSIKPAAFSPSYLDKESANLRPRIISPTSRRKIKYGGRISIRFTAPGSIKRELVKVTMIAPDFNTHSFTMNQRMLVVSSGNVTQVGTSTYKINSIFPNSNNLAPAGYYILFVVHQDIPSEGIWIRIQ